MTVEQIVSDAHDLTDTLKQRFRKQKIYVLAHSWGTIVGIHLIQQYPGDYYKYIGAGQIVDMQQNEKLSYQFTLSEAMK